MQSATCQHVSADNLVICLCALEFGHAIGVIVTKTYYPDRSGAQTFCVCSRSFLMCSKTVTEKMITFQVRATCLYQNKVITGPVGVIQI